MTRYSVALLQDIDELDNGHTTFRPVRHHFGIRTFGAIASTARAEGELLIKEHDETEPNSSEELYVVLTGRARFELDGQTEEVPAGGFVHVTPGVKRSAFAQEAGTTVLAIGAGPTGKPYEATDWEVFEPVFKLYESGDYAQAADRAQALLVDNRSSAYAYYNTACFESLAGRPSDAIAHLRRAVELSPSLAELASDDDDLASLRDHQEFAALTGD